MEYKTNTTCHYNNLNLYQTARCGKGVTAPVFGGAPFLSQFSNNTHNTHNTKNMLKSDEHVSPGQERHLPHEAWHVVQQKYRNSQKLTLPTKGNGQIYTNSANCCDTYKYIDNAYNSYQIPQNSTQNLQNTNKKMMVKGGGIISLVA
jgi:hypothetical protein